MSPLVIKNILRTILLITLQVLVFKQIHLGTLSFDYIYFFIYPVSILLLPIDLPKSAVMLIAFFIGITVDIFYDTPGVHSASLVFMAFLRPYVLRGIAPETGYKKTSIPTAFSFGLLWYVQYSSILIFAFLIVYFSIEAFTFVYIFDILANTFFSFIATMSIVLIHQILLVPKT